MSEQSNNTSSKATEAVKTVAGAAKGISKALAQDYVGAIVEVVKILPQLLKVLGVVILVNIVFMAIFLSTPSIIWSGISDKYENWAYAEAIENCEKAFDKAALDTCENVKKSFENFIPNYDELRSEYFSSGSGGQIIDQDTGNTFSVTIAPNGNDVYVDYYNAENNEFVRFNYINGNNYANDATSVNYTEILNAYAVYRSSQENIDIYDRSYKTNEDGTLSVIADGIGDSYWGDKEDAENMTEGQLEAYAWGMTDSVYLYEVLTSKTDGENPIFSVKYVCGEGTNKEGEEYAEITNLSSGIIDNGLFDSKSAFNNPTLAEDKGYKHYYVIDVNISTYNSETVETKTGLTYSKFSQELFDLTDEQMEEVASNTYISDALITFSMDYLVEQDSLPEGVSEYFTMSPAKKIFENLVGSQSVLQQMTDAGLVIKNFNENICRSLIASQAAVVYNSKINVTNENWFGIKDSNTFTEYFGREMEDISIDESGIFPTYVFYTALNNDTLKLTDSLFKTSNNQKLVTTEEYYNYFISNNRYYNKQKTVNGKKVVDLSGVQVADILFFNTTERNYDFSINIDPETGLPVNDYKEEKKTVNNYQIGIVTKVDDNNITCLIYNYTVMIGDVPILDNPNKEYKQRVSVININKNSESSLSIISGYAKPDYASFVNDYKTILKEQIEDISWAEGIVNQYTGTGELGHPLEKKYQSWDYVTATFPRYSNGSYHSGIDLGVPVGTKVYAAEAGTVETVKKLTSSYGYYIIINHGNGLKTLYAHNSKLLVSVGDKVQRGDLIAESGNTGNSTGPHLHFEVRLNEKAVDPKRYISFSD